MTQELLITKRPPLKRKRGRQRRGDRRVEFMLPELVYQRLLSLERDTGKHRASIAADLVIKALLG